MSRVKSSAAVVGTRIEDEHPIESIPSSVYVIDVKDEISIVLPVSEDKAIFGVQRNSC